MMENPNMKATFIKEFLKALDEANDYKKDFDDYVIDGESVGSDHWFWKVCDELADIYLIGMREPKEIHRGYTPQELREAYEEDQ